MRLSLGYMTREQELAVLSRPSTIDIIAGIAQAVTEEETEYVRAAFRDVRVSDEVSGYLMDLVERTRTDQFSVGVSTRGAIALYKAMQVHAALAGRDYALPEDIRAVAGPVLAHRITSGAGVKRKASYAALNGATSDDVSISAQFIEKDGKLYVNPESTEHFGEPTELDLSTAKVARSSRFKAEVTVERDGETFYILLEKYDGEWLIDSSIW